LSSNVRTNVRVTSSQSTADNFHISVYSEFTAMFSSHPTLYKTVVQTARLNDLRLGRLGDLPGLNNLSQCFR